ncbi:MAG: hypothetical protein WD314_06860 [Trueperaceae bacterium]
MTGEVLSMWDVLDGDWLYLGRPLEGVLDVATLVGQAGRVAPLFGDEASGEPFRAKGPAGLELLPVAAADLRGKEEWLRAALAQGATEIAFDPDPVSLAPTLAFPIDKGLWYVLSHRRETACL